MKVSLNNSLCFQMNNRRIGKVNEPGVNGLFSNSIALEAEKVKGDQYIGHSVSQPPKLEDDDYDDLASKWDPTHMSRDEYKEFVSYLRDKGIISDEEKRYLDGERIATSGQSWVSFDYPTPVEYGDENVLEYMRYEASLVYEHRTTYTEWGKNLSKKIVSILEEMEKSRLGVGNDLFDNTQSIHRILCPPCNAFNSINRIRAEACKQNKNVLFLIALGPTATVLAYDLFKAGYQAIDIGHVDIEYEWWRMGARRKVKLERKYVNEVPNGNLVADAGEEYNKQIIAKIS